MLIFMLSSLEHNYDILISSFARPVCFKYVQEFFIAIETRFKILLILNFADVIYLDI